MLDKLINFKKWGLVFFLVIIAGGIFLRSYNFSDWVRFNDDQVRDALIVDRMVSGVEFPLLGPKAGGTNFNLGPAFYYLEYFSAFLFGNTPESLAYPVLIFSILSIPLFYFIFKNIFIRSVTLALTAIYACSFFAIKYSRFAWNINLVPFFALALIYLLAKIKNENQKNRILFIILLGIVVGIGMQLHTLLLICFPLVLILFFLFDFMKKRKTDFKSLSLIILIALALNFPLIIYDVRSNGENIKSFFKGATSKTESEGLIREKILKDLNCQIQGSSFVLSAYGNNDECNIFQKDKESNGWLFKANILLSITFFIGGLALFLLNALKKKYFLENDYFLVMALYFLVSFAVFIPLSGEVSLRMFTVIIFVPFLLFGLWMKFMKDKIGKFGIIFSFIFVVMLLASNLFIFKNTYFVLGDMYRDDKYFGGASLGELNRIARYIIENSKGLKNTSISRFVSSKSLEYLVEKRGINVETRSDDEKMPENSFYFYIKKNDFRINKDRGEAVQSDIDNFNQLDSKIIGQYTVFKLEPLK